MIKEILFWQPESFSFNLVLFFFSHWFLWLVIFSLLIYWAKKREGRKIFLFVFLLLLGEVIDGGLKRISPWPRPFYLEGVAPPQWIGEYSRGSFPSGHALRTGLILSFLWRENRRFFWGVLPGMMLVNLGRILFSLHYPIDILGGLAIGFFLALVALGRKKDG